MYYIIYNAYTYIIIICTTYTRTYCHYYNAFRGEGSGRGGIYYYHIQVCDIPHVSLAENLIPAQRPSSFTRANKQKNTTGERKNKTLLFTRSRLLRKKYIFRK